MSEVSESQRAAREMAVVGLSAVVVGRSGTFDIRKCWAQSRLFHLLTEESWMSDNTTLGLSVFVCEMGLISELPSWGVVVRFMLDNPRACGI